MHMDVAHARRRCRNLIYRRCLRVYEVGHPSTFRSLCQPLLASIEVAYHAFFFLSLDAPHLSYMLNDSRLYCIVLYVCNVVWFGSVEQGRACCWRTATCCWESLSTRTAP